VRVGNAFATATILVGTLMPLTVVCTMLPTWVLFKLSNVRVAMAGTSAGTVAGADSVICPATGSVMTGWMPGLADHCPYPGVNVSVAPPGAGCQPSACGSAEGPEIWPTLSCESSSGELATALHVVGVAPATVSVTGSCSGFGGSV